MIKAYYSQPAYREKAPVSRFRAKVIIPTCFAFILFIIYYNYISSNWDVRTPFPSHIKNNIRYRIALIADMDKNNKRGNSWISFLKKGYLTWKGNAVSIRWDNMEILLKSRYNLGGRGMELSELVLFGRKLLAFDDRTGIVYKIEDEKVLPWIILLDGDGNVDKGFKSEWATLKGDSLYVGGMGKEWTTVSGQYQNSNPMWVKIISSDGEIRHENWEENYKKLRRSIGIEFPGYMIHEACSWSEYRQKWYFLPRRSCLEAYDEIKDEHRATNLLIAADEKFQNIEVRNIGSVTPTRGYSSFKFIPNTNDRAIVALKSEEYNGTVATYITAFTTEGDSLMPEVKISDIKYEGIEFI